MHNGPPNWPQLMDCDGTNAAPSNWFRDRCVKRPRQRGRGLCVTAQPSLDALREMLPPGLHRLPREPGDEEAIVETWL